MVLCFKKTINSMWAKIEASFAHHIMSAPSTVPGKKQKFHKYLMDNHTTY